MFLCELCRLRCMGSWQSPERWAPSWMKYLRSRVRCGLLRVSWKKIITASPPSSVLFCVVEFYDGNFKREWSQLFPKTSVFIQTLFNICVRRQNDEWILYLSPLPCQILIWGEFHFCQTTYENFCGFLNQDIRQREKEPQKQEETRKSSLSDLCYLILSYRYNLKISSSHINNVKKK